MEPAFIPTLDGNGRIVSASQASDGHWYALIDGKPVPIPTILLLSRTVVSERQTEVLPNRSAVHGRSHQDGDGPGNIAVAGLPLADGSAALNVDPGCKPLGGEAKGVAG